MSMRKWTILAAAMALTTSTFAASNPFSDVGRTHWAYAAIGRAVDAGILQGFDGKFHGDKLVNRYQMAVIIKKILDTVETKGGPAAAGMAPADIQNLEQLTIEFADELALLNVKVSTLEDSFTELRNQVDNIKMGGGPSRAATSGVGSAFTGFVAVALASTDDGTCTNCVAGSPGALTRWTGTTADQTFFTIPQASIALDTEVGDGIGLHVQYDYSTDVPNVVNAAGVGLNEAYLFVDELFGDIGGKIGGFALPYQSWEVNGAFRSCDMTISPSAKNTALEAIRVIGLQAQKTKDVDPADVKWSFLLFNGADATLPGAGATPPGIAAIADGTGLGALSASNTFDDSFGFGIDIESGDNPDRNWGWRLGYLDLGGDTSALPAVAPFPAGLNNSQDIDFWQIGFWWKNDNFKVVFEWIDGSDEFVANAVAGGNMDFRSFYLLVNFKMNDDASLTLRYDDFENEIDTVVKTGFDGNAITFAWNRKISDTSMFQFEYVTVDTDVIATPAPVGGADNDDDLFQFRYKVWF
jgi:hypothetical protein